MGFFQDITGKTASDAAKEAAALQYAREKAAGEGYRSDYTQAADLFGPFRGNGVDANNRLASLLGLNGRDASVMAQGDYVEGPDVGFRRDQGIRAIEHSAAGRNLNSGSTLKALMGYGTGLATQDYGNYLQRLMAMGQQGLGATSGEAGILSSGAGNLYNGTMKSAGTEPQGMIAGANARAAGSQNIMNMGAKLVGAAMGMPSFGGGASSFNIGNDMSGNPSSLMYGSNPFTPNGGRNPVYG